MIELRWVRKSLSLELQYRHEILSVDASGALCPGNEWSEWMDVPIVTEEEANK